MEEGLVGGKMKKIIILTLIFILLVTNFVFAQEIEVGIPRSVSVAQMEEDRNTFVIRWRNETTTNVLLQDSVLAKDFFFQVDIYIREGEKVISRNLSYYLYSVEKGDDGYFEININPVELGYTNNDVDIMKNTYSFRIRNGLKMSDILGSYFIKGSYSTPVNIGLVYPYSYASQWALTELDKSIEYDLLTDSMKGNMRDIVTRAEFSEIIVRFYESKTGNEIITKSDSVFIDSQDQNVLKAAQMGFINGYTDGSFKPNNPIFRQDIAVIITRALKNIYPDMSYSYKPMEHFEDIQAYAYDSIMFLNSRGILKGDEKGNLNPLNNTTREEAAVLVVRTYEMFK